MKKGILILMMIISTLICYQAKAIEINKPIKAQAYILDTPGDYDHGMWIVNNSITNRVNINYNDTDSEMFWEILQYNNNQRLYYILAEYNFPDTIHENQIVKFRIAYQTSYVTDTYSTLVSRIFLSYRDDPGQSDCGVTQTGYDTNIGAINYEVKCVTTGYTPQYVGIVFKGMSPDYTNRKYYISEGLEYRQPVSQEELYETIDEIHQGQQWMNSMIENAYTGHYDTTAPSDEYYQYVIDEENRILQELGQVNNVMTTNNIDTNAHIWIWDKATQILNTKSYIMGLYLTALTIGIIKLVLGR